MHRHGLIWEAKVSVESAVWIWTGKPIRWNVLSWPCRKKCQAAWFRRSEVAQSCKTLCDSSHCSHPGSFVHGFLQQEYWSGLPFPSPGNYPTRASNPDLLHGRQTLYPLSHQRGPDFLESQLLKEVVLGLKSRMSLCMFLTGCMLQLYRFHRVNDWFWISYLNSRFTKLISL